MQKGKLGLRLQFYVVLAFVLAVLGQTLLCALVTGVALLAERDENTSRQCLEAFFLTIAMSILTPLQQFITGWQGLAAVFMYSYTTPAVVLGVVNLVVTLGAFVLALRGLVRAAQGRETNTLWLSGLAYRACGLVQPGVAPKPPKPAPPTQQELDAEEEHFYSLPGEEDSKD